jgi:hypothetical protein
MRRLTWSQFELQPNSGPFRILLRPCAKDRQAGRHTKLAELTGLCSTYALKRVGRVFLRPNPLSSRRTGSFNSPGFICLVDTPTLGFVAMLAEDVADRYVVMGLENCTANRPLIILARSFLSPGRTFTNRMAFRVPWVRETRMSIFGANYEFRKQLVADYKAGLGKKPFIYQKSRPCHLESSSVVNTPRKRTLS